MKHSQVGNGREAPPHLGKSNCAISIHNLTNRSSLFKRNHTCPLLCLGGSDLALCPPKRNDPLIERFTFILPGPGLWHKMLATNWERLVVFGPPYERRALFGPPLSSLRPQE